MTSLLILVLGALAIPATASARGHSEVGAVVFTLEKGECNLLWLTPEGEFTRLEGQGRGVVTPSGRATLTCIAAIDFDDPGLATIEQTCSFIPDQCNGNGAITAADVLFCSFEGRTNQPVQAVANRGGVRVLVCQFPA